MSISSDFLRLNVGFILHQTVGFTRDFAFEIPAIHLEPDLDLENLAGMARITRTAKGLLVQTKMHAYMQTECVRCLRDFSQLLEIDFTDLYAFSPDSVDENGLLMPESGKIDLAPVIREEMLLAVPISPLCSPSCKGLCPICGENLNETTCNHEDEAGDAPLSQLRSLLD